MRSCALGIEHEGFLWLVGFYRRACDAGRPLLAIWPSFAPEKGLHVFAEAFIRCGTLPANGARARLRIAGWLGEHTRGYVNSDFWPSARAGLADALNLSAKSIGRGNSIFWRRSMCLGRADDVREPNGLFVWRRWPPRARCQQPDHGAFPECWSRPGRLFTPPAKNQLFA